MSLLSDLQSEDSIMTLRRKRLLSFKGEYEKSTIKERGKRKEKKKTNYAYKARTDIAYTFLEFKFNKSTRIHKRENH